jgi:hypothetical protein
MLPKLVAAPVNMAATDQMVTDMPFTLRVPHRSDIAPQGMSPSQYVHRKDENRNPILVGSQWNCFAIAGAAIDSVARSI